MTARAGMQTLPNIKCEMAHTELEVQNSIN